MAAVVQGRQESLKQLGGAFKAINDELKKDAPDAALLRANSAKMSRLSAQLPRWFPKGSGAEAGVKTAAKPEIWSDPSGFAEAAKALQAQTARFAQLSAGGDLNAFRSQVRPTGGACKGCHDKFRVEEKK
jgi:cytochrome c556